MSNHCLPVISNKIAFVAFGKPTAEATVSLILQRATHQSGQVSIQIQITLAIM